MSTTEHTSDAGTAQAADARAITHFKKSIELGKHWYLALLESIYLWRSYEEHYKGRHYIYLISGEAFDWLILAERLINEVEDQIPEDEKINLLFHDQPPVELPKDEFKKLIGSSKYKAYLNYIYGVLVEEALVNAVIEEIRKERRLIGLSREDEAGLAYVRIYGDEFPVLFNQFLEQRQYRKRINVSLDIVKEFTYWLFKYRLERADKSRAASDTKKALLYLQKQTLAKNKVKKNKESL